MSPTARLGPGSTPWRSSPRPMSGRWVLARFPVVHALFVVTAVGARNVLAVAVHANPTVAEIIGRWIGTAWTISSSFSRNSGFTSVAAPGSADVWAVDGSGLMQTQHWDGS